VTDAERLASITQQDRELNSWAFRSFRDIADGDYIGARLAYRAQLPAQFLWASQQALEKYLKCILFIRRIPAKRLKHDLKPAFDLIEQNSISLHLTERSRTFIHRPHRRCWALSLYGGVVLGRLALDCLTRPSGTGTPPLLHAIHHDPVHEHERADVGVSSG
jgi:hypothetical protein